MVISIRCFSLLEEQESEYETAKASATEAFYTASSNLNWSITKLPGNPRNLRVFTLKELKAATNNFGRRWKIGKGGYGIVYKGMIKSLEHPFDEIQVAVKLGRRTSLIGHKEWETEINVLGAIEHPNFIKLIGYCIDDTGRRTKQFLVYEYMVNGSVRDHLSAKSNTPLTWNMRLKVAQDIALAMTYLHEGMDFQIIFRDFKSANILLDDQWNVKLSDFGLARLGPQEGQSHVSTGVVGTYGYTAPEYIQTGRLTSKSDVWGYGVFLYELITGRPPLDRHRPKNEQKLLEWVRRCLNSKQFRSIVDPRLEDYSLQSAQRLSVIANKCLGKNAKLRPKMSEVLEMVNQLIEVPSQAFSPIIKTINHDKKRDSIDIHRILSSCLSCFRKEC